MITTISTLPEPPNRNDPTTFSDRADSFLAALPTLSTQLNSFVGEVNSLSFKTACKVATTVPLTLNTLLLIDDVQVAAGDRVLVKNQTNPAENGIYIASNSTWVRAPDMDTSEDVAGSFVPVTFGTLHGGKIFYTVFNASTSTLGTTPITWNSLTDASITGLGVLGVANGGTGRSSTGKGILYGEDTSQILTLPPGDFGTVLRSNGPADGSATWGKVSLYSDVTGVLPPANGGAGALSTRNKLINGRMIIAQRGTVFSAPLGVSGSIYTVDRWYHRRVTSNVLSSLSQTNVLNTARSRALTYTVTGTGSVAAGDFGVLGQDVEQYYLKDLIGYDFTISFLVKSSITGTFCIALQIPNFASSTGNVHSYVSTYTINQANTYEYKTITVPGGIPFASTNFTDANNVGLRVMFTLYAGSNTTGLSTQKDTWASATTLYSVQGAQTSFTSQLNNFSISEVILEKGSSAGTTPEVLPYSTDLQLCQRYYEKSYNDNVTPGTNDGAGTEAVTSISDPSTFQYVPYIAQFKVAKRDTPSTVNYWDRAGNISRITTITGTGLSATNNVNNTVTTTASRNGIRFFALPGVGNMAAFHWAADSELYN